MQYSFLGFSVSKMMDLNLDMKDIAILRYFVDFKDTGRMNTEVAYGVTYYWVNYRTMEEAMPYLALGKRAIMTRMLKLRDLGILNHYTKKEGGTFSFFTLGSKYIELTTVNKDSNKEDKKSNKIVYKNRLSKNILSMINEKNNEDIISEEIEESEEAVKVAKEEDNHKVEVKCKEEIKEYDIEEMEEENIKPVIFNEEGVLETSDSMFKHDYGVLEKEERVFFETVKGCVSKGRTKTPLLNNSSNKETNNIKKYIKKEIEEIIEYLNLKINTKYKASSHNTIKLITARLREGFSIDDFKTVIDKKFKAWFGTEFEQYLTPFTLFGAKFEQYLNQKVVSNATKPNNSYEKSNNYERPKLRFDNFKGRDYDYKELERKLLGW